MNVMDLLDIDATAKSLKLPVETVSGYASRFVLYVPAIRSGSRVLYAPEGVTLLGEIHDAAQSGVSLDDIETSLQGHFPVTVISPGNQAASETEVAETSLDTSGSLGNTDLSALLAAIANLPSADQIEDLRDETSQLRLLMAERDARQEIAKDIIEAELRSLTQQLRNEIATLRYELQISRNAHGTNGLAPAPAASTNGHHHPETDEETVKERNGRTPRRMGQPTRGSHSSN